MKKTTEFYKEALKQAMKARAAVEAAQEEHKRSCDMEKGLLEDGLVGKEGYDLHIAEFGQRRDEAIESALAMIDAVTDEYNGLMGELGRLDGGRIDSDTMKLLGSGIKFTSADWQEMADRHRDNAIMSRILKERYAEAPKEEDGFRVTFGQSPRDRQKVFDSFTSLIRHSCASGTVLREYADRESYWNDLARKSIGEMCPFSDENFDSVNEDFPVTYQAPRVDLW